MLPCEMLKRTAVPRSTTKLISRASSYNPSVTLFESDDAESPRRSKRIKLETAATSAIVNPDLEETVPDPDPWPKDTRKKKVKTLDSKPKQITKSPRKPKPIQQSLEVPHPAPPQWRETYNTITQMRSRVVAPVDTMGCDQAQYKEEDPKVCTTRPVLKRH